jgi:transcriptional regulator with XRE-family HTH domain
MDGRRIKEWLVENGKSREALAAELGVSGATIQRILSGRYTPPRVMIIALAHVMGVEETTLTATPNQRTAQG